MHKHSPTSTNVLSLIHHPLFPSHTDSLTHTHTLPIRGEQNVRDRSKPKKSKNKISYGSDFNGYGFKWIKKRVQRIYMVGSGIDLFFKRYPTRPLNMLYFYVKSRKSNPILLTHLLHCVSHYHKPSLRYCTLLLHLYWTFTLPHTTTPPFLHSWLPFQVQKK